MSNVSVVIPTYNRLGRLRRVLAGLERQTVPPGSFEVVVVSDGATDGTAEFLARYQGPLRLAPVLQANRGVAAARNSGFRRAGGELIIFIDDDVVPTPTLIAEHLQSHGETIERAVVLGPMLTPPDAQLLPWVRWEQAMLAKQYEAMISGAWAPTARQFYTGNTSLARRHLVEAGGFDEQFRRAEDVELAYRLAERGLRFVFNPEAAGLHYAERSFRSWIEIPYAYGRNDVIFTRDKRQSWLLPQVCQEFHTRSPVIRLLVRLCLGRRRARSTALAGLKLTSRLAEGLRSERLVQMAFSGMFNLCYYQGVADELGGRERFLSRV